LHGEKRFIFENKFPELIKSSNIRLEYSYKEDATKKFTQALYERTRIEENCIHDKFVLFLL
jgi:hypothetical protein